MTRPGWVPIPSNSRMERQSRYRTGSVSQRGMVRISWPVSLISWEHSSDIWVESFRRWVSDSPQPVSFFLSLTLLTQYPLINIEKFLASCSSLLIVHMPNEYKKFSLYFRCSNQIHPLKSKSHLVGECREDPLMFMSDNTFWIGRFHS
jgi:hypothetical protein